MKFVSDQFYLKSGEQMYDLFSHVPEAIENSVKIANKTNLTINLPGPLLPDYEIPPEFSSDSEYMRHIANEGLAKRYNKITKELQERLDYELEVIISMGFTGYFLIVWDFISGKRT